MFDWEFNKDKESNKLVWNKFRQDIEDDLDSSNGSEYGRILAACQDTISDVYLLIMAVPETALNDPESPDIWRTPDKKKFIVGLSEKILLKKVEAIEDENISISDEAKNELMARYIATFLPAMFERAKKMEPLDI